MSEIQSQLKSGRVNTQRQDLSNLNGIKVRDFSEKNIEKKHLRSHDKNYHCFYKSNISVTNLIEGSRNMIKLSKNTSL